MLDGVEVRLVDDDGDDVLVGDAGEIWVRGANVFDGYLDDPEATARVLTAGRLAAHRRHRRLSTTTATCTSSTGPRTSIIVSGFNVFPAEVEEVLAEHPAVAEVGVVGVPHPHTGEAVKAFVVLGAGRDVDEDALIDYCPRPPRPLQVPEQGHLRRRAAAQRRRQARSPPARRRSRRVVSRADGWRDASPRPRAL